MLGTLDARLAQARAGELGHLEFLQVLCQDEITRREATSLARRIRHARFETRPPSRGSTSPPPRNCPPPRSATSPPCAGSPAGSRSFSTARSASGRATSPRPSGTWPSVRRRRPVPQDQPRAGAPGRRARRPHLGQAAPRADPPRRPGPGRLRHARVHRRPSRRPLRADHRTGREIHDPTSNRAPADWYPLFPNPVVAESLLDRLINTSHQVFMNGLRCPELSGQSIH